MWGVLTGVTAVVLMLAGGLTALQNTVIVTSAPFLVIIAGLAVSFWRELLLDRRAERARVEAEERETRELLSRLREGRDGRSAVAGSTYESGGVS